MTDPKKRIAAASAPAPLGRTETEAPLHDPNISPSDPNLVGVVQPRDMVRMVVMLTAICVCVVLLLAVVNALTAEKIAENLAEAEKNGIIRVFGFDDIEYSPLENAPDTVSSVYEVTRQGNRLGWCVSVSPNGFGGNIDMVVGVSADGKIAGVTITSLSETPGLGSRVADENYLANYAWLDAGSPLTLNADVDAISGATISSRSVLTGVNRATAALAEMGLIGGDAE